MAGTSSCARSAPAKCRPKGMPRPGADGRADPVPAGRVRKGRSQSQARSRPRHGAPPESQRILQHHSRPAGRGFPRRAEISHRRFRLRLRQHRRRAHHLAGADGKISGRRRQDRLARHGRRPLPKPLEAQYATRTRKSGASTSAPSKPRTASISTASTPSASACRASARADAKPVTLGFWMDGKLLQTMRGGDQAVQAGLLRSVLRRADAPVSARRRPRLPRGVHRRRFRQGPDRRRTPTSARRTSSSDSITFVGPVSRRRVEQASRKKILICDPNTGQACVEKIVSNLAHHAYRRPVTKTEVASLMKFVAHGEGQRADPPSRASNWRCRRCWSRPHFLFRIERDPNPTDPRRCTAISDLELASRLSYFLWSSMPDDELLGLAEAGKLREPACWMRR